MSEQTFLSRIGNWFKRPPGSAGDANGDLPLEPPGDLPTTAVTHRSTFLRPWARRDQAISNIQNGIGALGDLMHTIRDNLEQQNRRQEDLLKYLSHLPEALQSIPESGRVQGETLKAIQQQLVYQNTQQSKLADILDKILEADQRQNQAVDDLKDRVETLHTHGASISDNLSSVGSAMQSVSRNTQESTKVLEQLQANLTDRDAQFREILHKQNARFTTLMSIAIFLAVAALAAVGVVGYFAYDALSRGAH